MSFRKVAVHYLSGVFIFDFLSSYPYFIASLAHGGEDYQDVMDIDYMKVFGYLRLLRITQIPKILGATTTYSLILIKLFPFKRQVIYNIRQVVSLVLFLYLSLHLTACINIFHGTSKDGWIPLDELGAPSDQSAFDIYIDQLYFMTTTMTTVGYGDFKAA